jgi:phosphoenolpyruvate---glycerone phosphotransferase subunit DhaL
MRHLSAWRSTGSAMDSFPASEGGPVLAALIEGIHANAARLSQIDGATGDGDHGVNMDKGFMRTRELLGEGPVDLAQGLSTLGTVLVTEIGGVMGPLYGSFYLDMAAAVGGADMIDSGTFDRMLAAGTAAVQDLGEARLGDKTLLDALLPAQAAYRDALASGGGFALALGRMADAAETGSEGTREMVARMGRASRLGERSRGFLDAGSVSCALQLRAMADAMAGLLTPSAASGAAG